MAISRPAVGSANAVPPRRDREKPASIQTIRNVLCIEKSELGQRNPNKSKALCLGGPPRSTSPLSMSRDKATSKEHPRHSPPWFDTRNQLWANAAIVAGPFGFGEAFPVKYNPALDGIRAVAILLVVGCHCLPGRILAGGLI